MDSWVGGGWCSLWLSWWRICPQCGRPGFDPWVGRFPREGKGYRLQYSGLENSMDSIVHGVTESDTTERLSLSLHGFWERKTTEEECPFHHVIWSTCLFPGNADLDHLAEVVFVRLFHSQVTLSPSLYCYLFWKELTMLTHSKGIGNCTPPPWEPSYLCQLSEIRLHGKFVYCLTCIQSFIYISMDP